MVRMFQGGRRSTLWGLQRKASASIASALSRCMGRLSGSLLRSPPQAWAGATHRYWPPTDPETRAPQTTVGCAAPPPFRASAPPGPSMGSPAGRD